MTSLRMGRLARGLWIPLLALCACERSAPSDGPGPTTPASTATGPAATAAAPTGKLVVGFSQIGAESAWRTANTESIKGEAARRGIALRFADAQQQQENQIKALRAFIA